MHYTPTRAAHLWRLPRADAGRRRCKGSGGGVAVRESVESGLHMIRSCNTMHYMYVIYVLRKG